MTFLEVHDLVAGYAKFPIINDINLNIDDGETLAVIGPNGSGKSTFAKTIIGFTNIFNGKISYKGVDITRLTSEKRIKLGIGYLPQTQNVFPDLTVQENLEMGGYSLSKTELKKRIKEMVEIFPELGGRLAQRAGTMSGGERQMLAMARLLMISPELVLLDEPSAGLSPKMVDRIYEKVELLRRQGITMVLIEQHASKAIQHSDRTVVMVGGRVVLQSRSSDMASVDLAAIFFQKA